MNHPVALVLITGVEIIVAHIKKLLDVIRQFIEKRIAVPDFIKNHQRKLIWSRWWHVRLRSKQWALNIKVIDRDLISKLQTHRIAFLWQTFEL